MATVTIAQGKLQGGTCKTDSGFEYYEFLEIPYAKPPVGDLRFKSPQEPESWNNVRDATLASTKHISTQVNFMIGTTSGDEDCLYLNVYTPQLTGDSKLRPVVFYIHGGGFIFGNGILKESNGPDYLVENDVVLVTINYRLGVLGFLSLDIPEASGNMGLKDQVKALQWVQKNIATFGGDKDNVTILGLSAGSASCEYLILSPTAKDLFHKAILMSGSTLNDWAINYEPKKLAVKLAEKMGYTGSLQDDNSLHEFFMKTPSHALMQQSFHASEEYTNSRVFFGFVPIIEKDFGDGQAFLTVNPYKLLKEGKFNYVPTIRGFCNKEGSLANMMKPTAVRQLIETKSFVDSWAYKIDESDAISYNKKLSTAYLNNIDPDEEAEFASNFYSDLNFVSGIWLAGKIQVKHGVPTYVYQFCFDGNLNAFKKMMGLMKKGAAHGDDIGYVFRNFVLDSQKLTEADVLIRNRVTKMWTDFAKTGNPTPKNSEIPVQWPQFADGSHVYLNIDKEFSLESNYEPEKMEVFEEIYGKYEK